MSGRLQVGDEQHEGEQDHQSAGDVHREVGERDDGKDRGDAADDTGQDQARVLHLRDDSVARDDDQQCGDGRIDEGVEEHLPERHRIVIEHGTGRVDDEAAVGPRHRAAVDLVEQGLDVSCLEVGDLEPHRLFRVDVHAVTHGLLRPVGVAAVHCGEVADAGDGVVQDLCPEVAGQVLAGRLDRMGGADVGAGGHRQHVRGLGDEQTGGGGSSAGGIDVDDHGHGGVEEAGHDLVHRGRDAAGRVHHHEESVGVVGFGAVDRALDVRRHDVVDIAVEVDFFDVRRGGPGLERQERCGGGKKHSDQAERNSCTHAPSMAIHRLDCPCKTWNIELGRPFEPGVESNGGCRIDQPRRR